MTTPEPAAPRPVVSTPGEAADVGAPTVDSEAAPVLMPVRRHINVVGFVLAGLVCGVIAGLLVDAWGPDPAAGSGRAYASGSSQVYLAAVFGLAGTVLGGVAAVAADALLRRGDRRS